MAKKTTKKKKTKSKTKSLAKKEYTDEEKIRLAKYKERANRKPVKFKTVKGDSGEPKITLQGLKNPLYAVKMLEALGTPESDLQTHLLNQAIQTFRGTETTDGFDNDKVVLACNTALSILDGIQPQDEIEGMLAVQMIGVHNMAMETLKRAMLSDQTFEGKQANVAQSTKMLRTFMAQMEALKKYRSGGQQRIVVEHVNVSEGGQAIVGVVNQGGGGNNKNHG